MQPHLYLLAIIAGTFSLSTSGDQVLVFSGSEAGVSVVWFQGKPRGKHVLFPWKMDRMVVPKFRVYSPICGSVGKWWSIIGFGAAFFSSATGESQLFVWPQLWQQLPEELRAMLTFSPSFHRWVVSFWAVNRRNILTRKYAYVYIYIHTNICVCVIHFDWNIEASIRKADFQTRSWGILRGLLFKCYLRTKKSCITGPPQSWVSSRILAHGKT